MGKLNAGGVESVVYNYYRHIDHNKIQFDFYVDDDSTLSVPKDILEMGARVFVIPRYQNVFQYMKALRKHFEEEKYQIVHSNMNTLSVFSLRAAKKAGVPCIALCGSVGVGAELAYSEGISAIFSSVRELGIKTEDPGGYEENLRFLTDSVMRTLMIASWEKTDGREDIRVQRNKKVVQWC